MNQETLEQLRAVAEAGTIDWFKVAQEVLGRETSPHEA